MGHLLEIEYEKIFSPKTMATLKSKSEESLRQLLRGKGLMGASNKTGILLKKIVEAERGHHDELEMLAKQIVSDAYPIIDYANIDIDAKIVTSQSEFKLQQPKPEDDPTSPDFGEDDPEKLQAKRRVVNGVTQGMAIRGTFGFLLFKEYLNQISKDLVDDYNEAMKLSFGIYDDPDAIAMMLSMLAQGHKLQGGESEMEYDDEKKRFVIHARALCFPMLVHEIVKGLGEIIGTKGFSADKAKNQAIVNAVDKLEHEPEDLQYGKFIHDALRDVFNKSGIDDLRVRDLFLGSVYELPDDEFFPFVENAINDELTPEQLRWAQNEMRDIEKDLRKDDTGLEDLDEGKISGREAVIEQLKFYLGRYYPNSREGREIAKIKAGVDNTKSDQELAQYLKDGFMNRANDWGTRLKFSKLRDAFEGK